MKPSQSQNENPFRGAPWNLGEPLLLSLRQLIEQSLAAWFSDGARLAELARTLQRYGDAPRREEAAELAGLVRALELIEQRTARLEQQLRQLTQQVSRLAAAPSSAPPPPAPARRRRRRIPCSPK